MHFESIRSQLHKRYLRYHPYALSLLPSPSGEFFRHRLAPLEPLCSQCSSQTPMIPAQPNPLSVSSRLFVRTYPAYSSISSAFRQSSTDTGNGGCNCPLRYNSMASEARYGKRSPHCSHGVSSGITAVLLDNSPYRKVSLVPSKTIFPPDNAMVREDCCSSSSR